MFKRLLLILLICSQAFGYVNLGVNGVTYSFPNTGDQNWGDNVTNWATAVTNGMLQKQGGAFTLTADANFGTSYGLGVPYVFSTNNITPAAATGLLRLTKSDSVAWRNNANSADLPLAIDGSNNLTFNGSIVSSSSGVVPVGSGGTGITSYTTGNTLYASGSATLSKLEIGAANTTYQSNGSTPSWGQITNAFISSSAAIAYSKLNLTGAILNADLAGSIAYNKLSLGGAILNSDLAGSIAYSKLSLSGAILNSDLAGSIARTKLAIGNASQVVLNDSSGNLTSVVSLLPANGGTGLTSYTAGDVLYATGAQAVAKLPIGSTNQVLTVIGGLPSWQSPTTAPNSSVICTSSSGFGATGTAIRKFTTCTTVGSDITYTADASNSNNGDKFVINTAGNYAVVWTDKGSSGTSIGVSVNSNQLTTDLSTITAANRVLFAQTQVTGNWFSVSGVIHCSVNDVVRAHGDGSLNGTTGLVEFQIIRVS